MVLWSTSRLRQRNKSIVVCTLVCVCLLILFQIGHGQAPTTGTVAFLQTESLIFPASKDSSCSSYAPDYSKYHTIVEVLDNDPIGQTAPGGGIPAGLPIYRVNTEGLDPISGEGRRLGFAMSFDPTATTQRMHSLFGEPGTRITFHGDWTHPFAPVPGISVWDGSIDIDLKCGVVIRAHGVSDASVEAGASPPKTDTDSMILHAQRLLKSLGYDPGPIDGKAGARTVEAIKEFQRRKQFPVNGLVSASLITALDSAKKNDAPRNK